MKTYYTYILTNERNKTLYTGVTNNIVRRLFEHKNHLIPGYTDKYNCTKLVYYEEFADSSEAIKREKAIKSKLRSKKINLIESTNPSWDDLSQDWGIPILSPEEREAYKKNMLEYNRKVEEMENLISEIVVKP